MFKLEIHELSWEKLVEVHRFKTIFPWKVILWIMVSFVMLFGEVLYKWVSGMSPMAKPASKSKFVFWPFKYFFSNSVLKSILLNWKSLPNTFGADCEKWILETPSPPQLCQSVFAYNHWKDSTAGNHSRCHDVIGYNRPFKL
jgi:hypothetical protein